MTPGRQPAHRPGTAVSEVQAPAGRGLLSRVSRQRVPLAFRLRIPPARLILTSLRWLLCPVAGTGTEQAPDGGAATGRVEAEPGQTMSLSDRSLQAAHAGTGLTCPSGAGGPESSVGAWPSRPQGRRRPRDSLPFLGPGLPSPRAWRLLRERLPAGCEGPPWALRLTSTRVEGRAWLSSSVGSRGGPRPQARCTPPGAASVQPDCTPQPYR